MAGGSSRLCTSVILNDAWHERAGVAQLLWLRLKGSSRTARPLTFTCVSETKGSGNSNSDTKWLKCFFAPSRFVFHANTGSRGCSGWSHATKKKIEFNTKRWQSQRWEVQRNKNCKWKKCVERRTKRKVGLRREPHKTELYLTEILFLRRNMNIYSGTTFLEGW